MPAIRYRILFQGDTLPNVTPQQVQTRLALLCQRPAQKLDALFSGERFWLQEHLSGRSALAYRHQLAEIGAKTELYRQNTNISAVSFPLPLAAVETSDSDKKSVFWMLGASSLVFALVFWLLIVWWSGDDAKHRLPSQSAITHQAQAALQVPAIRRHYLPAQPLVDLITVQASPPAVAHPLPKQEVAEYQSSWQERLRLDLKLLQGKVKQRSLLLPWPDSLTQITGNDLPELRLQRQGERIQVHIPAQYRALNQGLDRLVWQGLRGYLTRLPKGWKLRANHGDFKLAALQHGWLSLSPAHIQARLHENLQPQSVRLSLPSFEISDGVKRELSLKDLRLDVQLPRPHQKQDEDGTLPIPQGSVHNGALSLRNEQQRLAWHNALGLAAAQVQDKHLNYALHLRLDDVQATRLQDFALPESLQALQLTLLLRQLPLSVTKLHEVTKGRLMSLRNLQYLPQEIRAHVYLLSQEGLLEAQFSLRLHQAIQTVPPRWQDWLPWLEVALDIECDKQWLAALWQRYSSTIEFSELPLAYLQLHGYLRSQADNYVLHLRWQDGQLYLNDLRIGGYAEYQLAQQQRQISEAFSLLAGLQLRLETYYKSHGRFPANLQRLNAQTQGYYTDNIYLDSQTLMLQAQLKTGASIQLQFFPAQRRWQCQNVQQALPSSLLPAWCRH